MQTVTPSPVFNNIQQAQFSAPAVVRPAYPPALNNQAPVQTIALQNASQNAQVPSNTASKQNGGILNSMLDIGKTVAGGVAVGAVSGGVVSLLPFDNTELVASSLHDTILEAARESDTLPENLKNAGEPFNLAKEIIKAQEAYSGIKTKETLMAAQLELAKAFDDETIKNTLAEFSESLQGAGVEIKGIAPDAVLDSSALEALKTDALLKIGEAINKNTSDISDAAKSAATDNILNARNTFVESIKKFIKEAPAGDAVLSSAKTQAKIASSINLMGKAISFAVVIALITKLFDIMQPKKEKTSKSAENAAQAQTQTTQGANVWNMFSQSAMQGPGAGQNNFNKFMTLG